MTATSWQLDGLGFIVLGSNNTGPLQLSNTGHPANSSISLAHATKSHVSALGLSWNDASGKNNGQYAQFTWRSA